MGSQKLAVFAIGTCLASAFVSKPGLCEVKNPYSPYGPGTEVQVTASGRPVNVYVTPIVSRNVRPLDQDFAKVGKTPLTMQLPPGSYLVEVEGVDVSRGTLPLEVRDRPKRLLVETGSEGLGTTGSLLMGVGIACVLAGTVVLIGGMNDGPLQKDEVIIPFYAAGAGLIGAGVAMFVASRTDVEEQSSLGSGAMADARHSQPSGFIARLGGRF